MADENDDRELKTIKFQLMLSPGEAENIDDWMFRRRIRSRAEAIRRLCQIGIAFDENADRLHEAVSKLNEEIANENKYTSELVHGGDLRVAIANIFEARPRVGVALLALMQRLVNLVQAANIFGLGVKPDDAASIVHVLREAMKDLDEEIEQSQAEHEKWRADNLKYLGRE